jgi:hypothetical protein
VEEVTLMFPKVNPVRDREYLDWLRTQPCIITGRRGDDIDPAHIGTLGKGIKSSDDEAVSLSNEYHRMAHDKGEMSVFRAFLPKDVLRDALRAYARERYMKWKQEMAK